MAQTRVQEIVREYENRVMTSAMDLDNEEISLDEYDKQIADYNAQFVVAITKAVK